MKKIIVLAATVATVLTSCASKKEFLALQEKQKKTKELLDDATIKLNICEEQKKSNADQISLLKDKVSLLKNSNSALQNNVNNLATLSTKEAQNLERSLESIKEKDLQITSLRDAITKKDSVTLALVTSLKGALGNLNDEDIEKRKRSVFLFLINYYLIVVVTMFLAKLKRYLVK